jgi:hypothetical protein
VGNAGRVEQTGQRDAAITKVGLIVAHPDVVKRLVADDGDVHGCGGHPELVESAGGTECGPQAGETGPDDDHVGHGCQSTPVRGGGSGL